MSWFSAVRSIQFFLPLTLIAFNMYIEYLNFKFFWRSFIAGTLLALSGLVCAETVITLTHPEIPAPILLDHGTPGQSIGDIRLFHFNAKADNGDEVVTDWIMTTTNVTTNGDGVEARITNAVFAFGEGTKDQLIIQGVAMYPSFKSTLREAAPTARAITGGTGKFAGAGGWMDSLHFKDGTWQHVLHIK